MEKETPKGGVVGTFTTENNFNKSENEAGGPMIPFVKIIPPKIHSFCEYTVTHFLSHPFLFAEMYHSQKFTWYK